MKVNFTSLTRAAGLLAGAMLVMAGAKAAEADAFPTFDNNYIKLSAGGISPTGSGAAAQARTQVSRSGAAGIEELSYGYDLAKDLNLQIDGKALAGEGDYLAQFKLTKNEVGTVEAGYKQTRTFYDVHGGFFPNNNAWLPLYQRQRYVDRGKFFVDASLTLPKAPVITFKYSNETRTGTKDSTIWGDSDLTGLPAYVGAGSIPATVVPSSNRKILPAYITLNERLQTWELSARHTVGNTTAVASIGGSSIHNLDSRSVDRYVGEMRPWPPYQAPTAATATVFPAGVPAIQIPNNAVGYQTRGADTQRFWEHGFTTGVRIETVLNDKVTVFAGAHYQTAGESTSASRLLVSSIPTATGIAQAVGGFNVVENATATLQKISAQRPSYSYTSDGNTKFDLFAANAGVQLKLLPDLHVEAALKGESYKDSGDALAVYQTTAVKLSTGETGIQYLPTPESFHNKEKPWTPSLDVRYSGIRNLALYGEWEYRTTKQEEYTNYTSYGFNTAATSYVNAASATTTAGTDNIKEKHSNLKVGGSWTPVSFFTGRAEFFTKDHENRFNAAESSDYYILNYDIYGVKLTGTVKPLPGVALTTRYVVQRGKAVVNDTVPVSSGITSGVANGNASDSRRHQISETVDWNPNKTVYVQVNGSVVYDYIATAYPYVTGVAQNVIRNATNNYYNGDATVGFAIDKETDFQFQGTYYRTNNYQPAQAAWTLPLGASAKEYTVSAGVKYKIDPKTVFAAKVGYIDSKSDTFGGFTNFRGPLAYVSVTRAF